MASAIGVSTQKKAPSHNGSEHKKSSKTLSRERAQIAQNTRPADRFQL
jgi:hypothetical protein